MPSCVCRTVPTRALGLHAIAAYEKSASDAASQCPQEESSQRGLKRAYSSSGAISEPKRQSVGQQQDISCSCCSTETERSSTGCGARQRRATPPVAIPGLKGGEGGRRGERKLRHLSMENCNEARQHRSESMSRGGCASTAAHAAGGRGGGGAAAAANDSASLSRLLDDTVQLLGQSSLIMRQPSAPAIMLHHTCSTTVRALNASLSSGSLAAQAAAGMEGIEESPSEAAQAPVAATT